MAKRKHWRYTSVSRRNSAAPDSITAEADAVLLLLKPHERRLAKTAEPSLWSIGGKSPCHGVCATGCKVLRDGRRLQPPRHLNGQPHQAEQTQNAVNNHKSERSPFEKTPRQWPESEVQIQTQSRKTPKADPRQQVRSHPRIAANRTMLAIGICRATSGTPKNKRPEQGKPRIEIAAGAAEDA